MLPLVHFNQKKYVQMNLLHEFLYLRFKHLNELTAKLYKYVKKMI
jgi:hypothetical protein